MLITGATGYLGSAIVRNCVAAGMRVLATQRKYSCLDRLADLSDKITFYGASDEELELALREGRCDAIIHTATCYGRQKESLAEQLETNCRFPLNLLEKAVAHKVGVFLNIDTVLAPQVNAYALSNSQFADWGRLVTASETNELRFVNIRMEHFYGPGDASFKFITYIIRKCLTNDGIIPLTEGLQKRDFIHVNDAVSAVMKLLYAGLQEEFPIGWLESDVGSGSAVTIRSLVNTVKRLSGSQVELCFGAIPYRANELMVSVADISLLSTLGWECNVPLEEGLKNTIDFEKGR